MPYYIGDVIKDESRLVARSPEKFRETGVDVRINTAALGVNGATREVLLSDESRLSYDLLVIATGATASLPRIPGAEREGVFILKALPDALRIKTYLKEKTCRRAVIVGAGFIALEMAEAFRTAGMETTVVHRGTLPASRWDREFASLMLEEMARNKVSFIGNSEPKAVTDGKDGRLSLVTSQGEIDADVILFALGVKPNVKFAVDAGVTLGESGAVAVNYYQETNVEGVYAVGDCCQVFHRISKRWVNMPLGDVANKQGRILGRNLGGGKELFPGVVGAQSFKLFNLEVAATGIDEREALSAGYHPAAALIWDSSIGASMPGASPVGIKLVADRATGRLLGAQALGEKGAVSRINILSASLWAGMTLDDIARLDLAYSPPFSGAWDPIHTTAQVLIKEL